MRTSHELTTAVSCRYRLYVLETLSDAMMDALVEAKQKALGGGEGMSECDDQELRWGTVDCGIFGKLMGPHAPFGGRRSEICHLSPTPA